MILFILINDLPEQQFIYNEKNVISSFKLQS